jgi:hypothetical protein
MAKYKRAAKMSILIFYKKSDFFGLLQLRDLQMI